MSLNDTSSLFHSLGFRLNAPAFKKHFQGFNVKEMQFDKNMLHLV